MNKAAAKKWWPELCTHCSNNLTDGHKRDCKLVLGLVDILGGTFEYWDYTLTPHDDPCVAAYNPGTTVSEKVPAKE